jgi:hypothetical protein
VPPSCGAIVVAPPKKIRKNFFHRPRFFLLWNKVLTSNWTNVKIMARTLCDEREGKMEEVEMDGIQMFFLRLKARNKTACVTRCALVFA